MRVVYMCVIPFCVCVSVKNGGIPGLRASETPRANSSGDTTGEQELAPVAVPSLRLRNHKVFEVQVVPKILFVDDPLICTTIRQITSKADDHTQPLVSLSPFILQLFTQL